MVRFALIGTNFITDNFMDAGSQCEGFHVQAVYSRTMKRAKEFAEKYGIEDCYDSLDDPYGYTLEATILDDFWKKTQFKEQIKKPLIFGNISTIENGFNHIVKSDLFSSFADCFDEIENSLMTEENFKNTIKIIKDISKFYQLNESFSYKKKI